jgi:hypothetical protein
MDRKTQNKMEVKKPHKRKAGGVKKAYSLIIIRMCQTVTNIKIHKQIKDTKNHTYILLTSHFFPPVLQQLFNIPRNKFLKKTMRRENGSNPTRAIRLGDL